jgi:sugar phosphate isomerase/epimerase
MPLAASSEDATMRFCYAPRRHTLYPESRDPWHLAPADYTPSFLDRVKGMGFDALEVGLEVLEGTGGSEREVKAFGRRLRTAGTPIGCVRAGGTLTDARHGPRNRQRQVRAIELAGWVGAEVVNTALSAPARRPGHPPGSLPGSQHGWPVAQDASRDAMLTEYEALAKACQAACDRAAAVGVTVSVEVHQNSLVDNSWSARLLHGLVARKNFGVNPDLGNVYWTYDVPEESPEDCIRALAPLSVYWHCKNLFRVYHPELQRSVFLRVPLPDGEIDYRFAMSAMREAGYAGYMAIEGAAAGDQFHADRKSLEYAKAMWAELERVGRRRGRR